MTVEWNKAPIEHRLSADFADIWRFSLDLSDDESLELYNLLSDDERARADRLKVDEKRNQFVITRGRLRQTLARIMGCDAHNLLFEYTAQGKPVLAGQWQKYSVTFNVSHSYDIALIGITLERRLGIDIEKIQYDTDFTGLARRFFSNTEQEALNKLSEDVIPRVFYSCWTKKEAVVKALGEGITFGLDAFDVSVDLDELHAVLKIDMIGDETSDWSVFSLLPNENYTASLAVEGNNIEIRCWI